MVEWHEPTADKYVGFSLIFFWFYDRKGFVIIGNVVDIGVILNSIFLFLYKTLQETCVCKPIIDLNGLVSTISLSLMENKFTLVYENINETIHIMTKPQYLWRNSGSQARTLHPELLVTAVFPQLTALDAAALPLFQSLSPS